MTPFRIDSGSCYQPWAISFSEFQNASSTPAGVEATVADAYLGGYL